MFACCLNERSLLRPINEVKGHQVQNVEATIKTILKPWGKMHFAANVLQSKHGTCPLSVFACCPNERSLLRPIDEDKGHQVQKYVKYIINSVFKPRRKRNFAANVLQSDAMNMPYLSICMLPK